MCLLNARRFAIELYTRIIYPNYLFQVRLARKCELYLFFYPTAFDTKILCLAKNSYVISLYMILSLLWEAILVFNSVAHCLRRQVAGV